MNDDIKGFDEISKKLNTTFENGEEISTDIQKFEKDKTDLVERAKKEEVIEDQFFIQNEIKTVINNGKNVLQKIDDSLKVGSQPRMFEVYATVMNSLISSLKELKDLNYLVENKRDMQSDTGGRKQTNIYMNMTGKEVLDMINNASKENELKEISADFTIDDKEERNES